MFLDTVIPCLTSLQVQGFLIYSLPPFSIWWLLLSFIQQCLLLKWAKSILKVPSSPPLRVFILKRGLVQTQASTITWILNQVFLIQSLSCPVQPSPINLPKHMLKYILEHTLLLYVSNSMAPHSLQNRVHAPESGKWGPLRLATYFLHLSSQATLKPVSAPYCFHALSFY